MKWQQLILPGYLTAKCVLVMIGGWEMPITAEEMIGPMRHLIAQIFNGAAPSIPFPVCDRGFNPLNA